MNEDLERAILLEPVDFFVYKIKNEVLLEKKIYYHITKSLFFTNKQIDDFIEKTKLMPLDFCAHGNYFKYDFLVESVNYEDIFSWYSEKYSRQYTEEVLTFFKLLKTQNSCWRINMVGLKFNLQNKLIGIATYFVREKGKEYADNNEIKDLLKQNGYEIYERLLEIDGLDLSGVGIESNKKIKLYYYFKDGFIFDKLCEGINSFTVVQTIKRTLSSSGSKYVRGLYVSKQQENYTYNIYIVKKRKE